MKIYLKCDADQSSAKLSNKQKEAIKAAKDLHLGVSIRTASMDGEENR